MQYLFYRTNIYLKRQNQVEQWSVLGESARWADLTIRLIVKASWPYTSARTYYVWFILSCSWKFYNRVCRYYVIVSVCTAASMRPSVCFQEVSIFLFEKRMADKLHKPGRREKVAEILRKEVKQMSRLKHPKILRLMHPLEECKWVVCSGTQPIHGLPLGTGRCCGVESTSLTLIQRRNNVACPVGAVVIFAPRYLLGARCCCDAYETWPKVRPKSRILPPTQQTRHVDPMLV